MNMSDMSKLMGELNTFKRQEAKTDLQVKIIEAAIEAVHQRYLEEVNRIIPKLNIIRRAENEWQATWDNYHHALGDTEINAVHRLYVYLRKDFPELWHEVNYMNELTDYLGSKLGQVTG